MRPLLQPPTAAVYLFKVDRKGQWLFESRQRIREDTKWEVGFTSSHPTRLAPSDESFMIGYLLLSRDDLYV